MGNSLRLLSDGEENILWDKIYKEHKFMPDVACNGDWIKFSGVHKMYKRDIPWEPEQESVINSFFEKLIEGEIYALDWQHDCFMFSPKEHIPFEYEYFDAERECQVYFPTYFSNGDYYFFFDSKWKYGLFGHPWRGEFVVIGQELIDMFESNKQYLGII